MELTLEWDPAVVEVTGIAPGPWLGKAQGSTVRFDAERVSGSARLQFNRSGAALGLPSGELARLTVRALAAGETSIRLSAGSALGRSGGVRPAAKPALLSVRG